MRMLVAEGMGLSLGIHKLFAAPESAPKAHYHRRWDDQLAASAGNGHSCSRLADPQTETRMVIAGVRSLAEARQGYDSQSGV